MKLNKLQKLQTIAVSSIETVTYGVWKKFQMKGEKSKENIYFLLFPIYI